MRKNRRLQPAVWTSFWKAVGLVTVKRNRLLATPDRLKNSTIRPLLKIGVGSDVAEHVWRSLSTYRDPLTSYYLSQFFRRDPQSVKEWLGASDFSSAFAKLHSLLIRSPLKELRERFGELNLLHEYNRKGEGWLFQAEYAGRGSVSHLPVARFTRLLNRWDSRLRYRAERSFRIGSTQYICFSRQIGSRKIYKFVTILRQGPHLMFRISADSLKEVLLIKRGLRNEFGVMLDSPQVTGNFRKLSRLFESGTARHFQLIGVQLQHDLFQISIQPSQPASGTVADYASYREMYRERCDPKKGLLRFRLAYLVGRQQPQVFIDVRNSTTSAVLGAVLLSFAGKRLNRALKASVRKDFEADFGLPLDTFIGVKDLRREEIYDRLLSTRLRKPVEHDLRSEEALKIYRGLVKRDLLPWTVEKASEPRRCVNRQCSQAYKVVLNRKFCATCGELLLPGKAVVLDRIDEKRVAMFVTTAMKAWQIPVSILKRRLLGRVIYVVMLGVRDRGIEIIPLARPLSQDQLMLLRLRYANAYVLSSRDDLAALRNANVECASLSHFIYNLDFGTRMSVVTECERALNAHQDRQRLEASSSRARMTDPAAYRTLERRKKNLGAESFEADCAVLLRYIFGKAIWLGAKTRGSALPDGMTALPVTSAPEGCFLWDAKYGQKSAVTLGSDSKNLKYIHDGRLNQSIRANGGLKALLFISNRRPPSGFEARYSSLLSRRKIEQFKILFILSDQLVQLYDYFREIETEIQTNQTVQDQFVAEISHLLFCTSGSRKAHVVSGEQISGLIDVCNHVIREMRTPSLTP